MPAVIVRIAMLFVAVAAIAVSAIWLSDAHRFAGAQSAALASHSPAEFQAAARRFEGASTLSPDTDAKAAEAYALLAGHRPARAEALLDDVVRQEPRNVRGWIGVYVADRGRKPARAAFAQARIRVLSPPVGR
jgi:predicted Zn-dependent protease